MSTVAFLQLSNSDGDRPISLEHAKVFEMPGFTRSERDAQRAFCASCCGWLPVVMDLAYESSRSRLALCLVLLQAFSEMLLQVFLPQVGFPTVPSCGLAAEALASDPSSNFINFSAADRASIDAALPAAQILFYAYLLSALLGLSRWNAPCHVLLGAALATASFCVSTLADAQYCFRILPLPPTPVIFPEGADVNYSGNSSSAVVLFNLLRWGCTVVVGLVLLLKTLPVVRAWRHEGQAMCSMARQGPSASGSSEAPAFYASSGPASPTLWSRAQHLLLDFYTRRVLAVPVRHVVACALSTLGLLLLAINLTSLLAAMLELVVLLRGDVNDPTFRPNGPLPDDDPLILMVLFVRAIPWQDRVLGTLEDALRYAPLGIQCTAATLILAILYSFYPVAAQHAALTARYRVTLPLRRRAALSSGSASASGSEKAALLGGEVAAAGAADAPADAAPGWGSKTDAAGLTVLGATAVEEAELLLAPDLRRFYFLDASQYIVAHLAVNLIVCLITTLLVILLVAGLVIACGGFAQTLLWVLAAARAQAWALCTVTLPPYLLLYVIGPALACCGLQAATVLAPCRGCYMRCCSWASVSDGPYVLSQRALLLRDALLSVTLGAFLGVVDALTRFALSLLWGALRTVLLHEPVVPRAAASLDRPFMAHGGMMRMALAAHMDVEETGEAMPPI